MVGKLKPMLDNLDHFVEALAVSRSLEVKDWDLLSVTRAFEWGTYFQHVHRRFEANNAIRETIELHLQKKNEELGLAMRNYQLIRFNDLGRSEEILYMSLLRNKAVPRDVLQYLVGQLYDGVRLDSQLQGLHRIISQKAATQLLLSLPCLDNPIVTTQAEMLRSTLVERMKTEDRQMDIVSDVLHGIPPPQIQQILAAVLDYNDAAISDDHSGLSHVLLNWLLGNESLTPGFFMNLGCEVLSRLGSRYPKLGQAYMEFLTSWGSSMEQDVAHGTWTSPSPEMSFSNFTSHFRCLRAGPEDLRTAADRMLQTLKAQDGDYNEPGLSIWTDLLLELQKSGTDRYI